MDRVRTGIRISRQNRSPLVDLVQTVKEKSVFQPKQLARQLDFTELNGLTITVDLPLPEQSKSQPKPKTRSQLSLRPPPRPHLSALELGSYTQNSDGTLKEPKHCKCKRSKCLKLYCECFSRGTFCDGCSCVNCKNNDENNATRQRAVGSILERNPNAFSPKIHSSPHTTQNSKAEVEEDVVMGKHNKGCRCKKSGCLMRYCECFQANIICCEHCKCIDCKNVEGCQERSALSEGCKANTETSIQQTNAAIIGAIGFSGYRSSRKARKRKGKECFLGAKREVSPVFLGAKREDLPVSKHAKNQQVNHVVRSAALSSSKVTYRSLLSGTIQAQDARDLCSILVVVSEAAKVLSGRDGSIKEQPVRENQTPGLRAAKDCEKCQEAYEVPKPMSNDPISGNPVKIIGNDTPDSGHAAVNEGRPMSPGTLALMCDEKDAFFAPEVSSGQIVFHGCNTDVYSEQERLVLVKFCDCLNRVITRGNTKETECLLSIGVNTEELWET